MPATTEPLPTAPTLLAYARDVGAYSSPLPHDTDRLRAHGGDRGAYPVAALPAAALAVDLSERGVAYRDGVGYTINGDRVGHTEVGVALAALFDEAVALLPGWSRLSLKVLIGEHNLACRSIANRSVDDLPSLRGLPRYITEPVLSALESFKVPALAAAVDRAHAELDADEILSPAYSARSALRATARDLRESRGARRIAATSLRVPLERLTLAALPSVPSADVAREWLATLDDRTEVRRSEVKTTYQAAGCPGDAAPSALWRLASERWGAPRKSNGHIVYRPASPSIARS